MDPDPHALNGDDDELIKLTAGTYSLAYLRRYALEHGGVPPEVEATTVDRTDRVMGLAAEICTRGSSA